MVSTRSPVLTFCLVAERSTGDLAAYRSPTRRQHRQSTSDPGPTWRQALVGVGLAGALALVPALAQAEQVPSDKLTAVVKPLCGADPRLCAEATVRSGAVAPRAAARARRAALPAGYPLWELQMNLCNSGF